MVTGLSVEHKRLLPGCSAGLAERTAVLDLRYTGQWSREAGERIRACVTARFPEEPLYGFCESDWPAAFLTERVDALADSFDEFVLGCDLKRVRECADYDDDDPVATMLTASRDLLTGCGVAAERIRTEADPHSAIRAALESARPGDLVVLLAEPAEALGLIDSYGGRFTG